MPTYYRITLQQPIPAPADILNKKCDIVFYYRPGNHSHPYAGTVFAWQTPNTIVVVSLIGNIEDGWAPDTIRVELTIQSQPLLQCQVAGIQKLPLPSAGGFPPARATGDARTELDQIIAGLPWIEGWAYGDGVDAITGKGSGRAVKSFTPKRRTGN